MPPHCIRAITRRESGEAGGDACGGGGRVVGAEEVFVAVFQAHEDATRGFAVIAGIEAYVAFTEYAPVSEISAARRDADGAEGGSKLFDGYHIGQKDCVVFQQRMHYYAPVGHLKVARGIEGAENKECH